MTEEHRSYAWLGKVSAAALLGFTLAIALSGILWRYGVAGIALSDRPALVQLCMWLVAPVWALVLSFCFYFRSGWRAWGWLLAANLIAFAAYFAGA